MKRKIIRGFIVVGCVPAVSACGGGGGGGGTSAPKTVAVKLSTVAPGQNPQIKGLEVTLALPEGATLKTVSPTKQTTDGVVRYSGEAAFSNLTSQMTPRPLFGAYSAARAPGNNTVTISFIATTAFGPGEFATVYCDLAGGMSVTANSFQITNFHATGDSATMLADDLTFIFDTPKVTLYSIW